MSNLYGQNLAKVFDKMYQGFIDYEEEYQFYANFCKLYNANSILEIGCGSGNLAIKFAGNFKKYIGLDYSVHMLSLAKEKLPTGNFIHADMRDFTITKPVDAALITGRSSSYLLTDNDLNNAFQSINKALKCEGIFIFDCIDASKFVPYIKNTPNIIHNSIVENVKYSRETYWFREKKEHFMINWAADYFKHEMNEKILLGKDAVIFRVFTKEEICNILKLTGFKILKTLDRKTYAFETFVVIAEKTI